jgi:hypothetical protein
MSDSLILGSNLVSFVPGVPSEDRADIMDILLLAELQASERHSREKRWEAWITAYIQALANSGLRHQGLLSQPPRKITNKAAVSSEAGKLFFGIRPVRLAQEARSALEQMFMSEHAQSYFRHSFDFSSDRSDSFQIVPCEREESGLINIAVCGLNMLTRPKPRLRPWRPVEREMVLTLRGGNFIYQQETYARHREDVKKALQAAGANDLQLISI